MLYVFNIFHDICWCSEGICHDKQTIKTRKYQKVPGNSCEGEIDEDNPELKIELTCEMADGYNKYIHFGKDSVEDQTLNVDGSVEKSETRGSSTGLVFILLMLAACVCGATYY